MGARRRARPGSARPTRALCRDSDGRLYDLEGHWPVRADELRADVRSGRRFRAYRHDTGADCTYEVLVEVLAAALPVRTPPAEGNLATTLDVLWKGVREVLDERHPYLWDTNQRDWTGSTPDTHATPGAE